jgi:hypothetical protein
MEASMTRIEKILTAMATLLGLLAMILLSSRESSAQINPLQPLVYCDTSANGIVTCNCSDNGNGTVCAGNNVTLYWCTTTATATCVAANQKQCPLQSTGFAATGSCSAGYTFLTPSSPCTGGLKNSCL